MWTELLVGDILLQRILFTTRNYTGKWCSVDHSLFYFEDISLASYIAGDTSFPIVIVSLWILIK